MITQSSIITTKSLKSIKTHLQSEANLSPRLSPSGLTSDAIILKNIPFFFFCRNFCYNYLKTTKGKIIIMMIVIPNADKKLINVLKALNSMRTKPYEIIKQDKIYTQDFIESIKKSEQEFGTHVKNGTLKTFKTANEAFKDAGLA